MNRDCFKNTNKCSMFDKCCQVCACILNITCECTSFYYPVLINLLLISSTSYDLNPSLNKILSMNSFLLFSLCLDFVIDWKVTMQITNMFTNPCFISSYNP